MAQDPRKRQKVLERKAAKERQKRSAWQKQETERRLASSPRALYRVSGKWPVHDVMISENWRDSMTLTQVLVSRKSTQGQIAMGTFLVDPACLGVKNATAHLFEVPGEYGEFRERLSSRDPMIPADLNLAAKIVRDAVAYARDLGFEPHPDFFKAVLVLEGADPDACATKIPLGGPENKPFFVAGPHDNAPRILNHLTRRLGPDGYNFLAPLDPDAELYRALPEGTEDEEESDEFDEDREE